MGMAIENNTTDVTEENEENNSQFTFDEEIAERLKRLFMGQWEEDGERITKYREKLDSLLVDIHSDEPLSRSIVVNYDDIIEIEMNSDVPFSSRLSYALMNFPEITIRQMERIVEDCIFEIYGDEGVKLFPVYVRIKNVNNEVKGLEEFRAEKNGKLIEVIGTVIKTSKKLSVLVIGNYKCSNCGYVFEYQQPYSFRYIPPTCQNPNCEYYGKSARIVLDADTSKAVDYQEIIIQNRMGEETTDTKGSIRCLLRDDLVGIVDSGEDVRITGIIKTSPTFNISKEFFGDPTLIQVLYASYIEKLNDEKLEEYHFSEEDFERMVATPEAEESWWNRAVSMIAPSIQGMRHLKEAALLQLLSGVEIMKNDGTKRRGTINVLIVGDPGTGKTTIGESLRSFSQRYQYLSTQNATAAGMTAAVVKEGNGPWMVMAGATVLANGGICVIDEFEKMSREDMTRLHEQLASQRVTVRKAGIHKTLSAKCDVLALANPSTNRFDPTAPLSVNLNKIPSSIYSRFDLIFTVVDEAEEETDRRLIRHMMLDMMNESTREIYREMVDISEEEQTDTTDRDKIFLREFIRYMRNKAESYYTEEERKNGFVPIELSPEAAKVMEDFFIEIRRQAYNDPDSPIPITKRAGESLYRLASARAKFGGRRVILKRDMECVISLYKKFLDEVFKDPNSGEYDSNIYEKGESRLELDKERIIISALSHLMNDPKYKGGVTKEDLIEYLIENNIVSGKTARSKQRKADTLLKQLETDGYISEIGGYMKITSLGKRYIRNEDDEDIDSVIDGASVFDL